MMKSILVGFASLAFLAPFPAFAAIALVSHTGASSVGGVTLTTSGINTTGSTLEVVVVTKISAGRTATFSDSQSNTWTALTPQDDGVLAEQMYYTDNPITSASQTFTVTVGAPSSFPSIEVETFSGTNPPSFDVQNGAQGAAATTQQPGSITPSLNGEVVVTGIEDNVATAFPMSINGGYTITDQETASGGNNVGGAMAYLIQTSAAATNPTWTLSGVASAANLNIASFKALAVANTRAFLNVFWW